MKRLFSSLVITAALAFGVGRLSAPQTIGAESQWVTVIREGDPVWVELEPSFPNALTVTPTQIIQPSATRTNAPTATATRTSTPTTEPTPTKVTPQPTATRTPTIAPTATATLSPMQITCDAYPCDVRPTDIGFPSGVSFEYQPQSTLRVRIGSGTIYAQSTEEPTVPGLSIQSVWIVRIKGPNADSERWACKEFANTCKKWFAIQGDFVTPFGVLEVYALDVTDY